MPSETGSQPSGAKPPQVVAVLGVDFLGETARRRVEEVIKRELEEELANVPMTEAMIHTFPTGELAGYIRDSRFEGS